MITKTTTKIRLITTAIFLLFGMFCINAQTIHNHQGHNHSSHSSDENKINVEKNDFASNPYGISEKEWFKYADKTYKMLEKVDVGSFINYVIFSSDGKLSDKEVFMSYKKEEFTKDRLELIRKVGKGEITENTIKQYLASLQPKYKEFFKDFLQSREAIVENHYRQLQGMPNPEPFACGQPCTNPGFESGTTFWNYWTATACASSTSDPCSLVAGFSAAQHAIQTVGGFDPIVGGTTLPVVPPGGGNNTLLLGDRAIGGQAARASISFTVSAASANFTYRYAVVLEDPVSGHTDPERPYFSVKIRDNSGNVLTCGDYYVSAKPPISNFFQVGSTNYYYRPWTTVFVPLSSYIGQCITVEFTSSDCAQTGHLGYAYIDGDCDPLEIITSSPAVCGGNSVTLTAPAGGVSYAWTNTTAGGTTGIVGPANTQVITVNQGGTYQVVITSVAGPSCTTTLNIPIGSNPSNPVAQFNNTTVCVGSATTFTDTSTPVGSINAWSWDFNNDGVEDSNIQNPTYTFPAAGSYPVTLTITWGPCNATITQNVTVNPGVSPTITPAGPFCNYAAAVNLTASVPGGTWSGTGITNTTTGTFTPSSATVGNNTVTYTVGGACPASVNTTIVVNAPPVSDAGPDITICSGGTGNIGSANNPAFTYSWAPGTGLSSTTISNPSVNLTNGGAAPVTSAYTVTTTETATGCISTDVVDVTVNILPTVNAGLDQTICAGSTVTLAGIIGGAASSATWSGGTGSYAPSATNLNAVYTPSAAEVAAGTVTLTLTTDDPAGPCIAVNDQMVININIPATVNAGVDQTVCIGSTVTLAGVIGGSASSGTWSGGGGIYTPNATTANAVYTPTAAEAAAGTVTLTYTTDDPIGPCTSVNDQMVITINPLPTVNAGVSQTVCVGGTITLGGAVGGAATSGTWSGGTGTYSPNANTLNAVYTPSAAEYAAGSVTLTLTTNDPAGPCNAVSATVTHNFNPLPAINFVADDRDGCPVHCVNFTDNTTVAGGGSVVSWVWNFGDGSPTDTNQNPSHCFSNSGYYDITLTATSNQGCVNTYTFVQMIFVFPVPTAEFTPNPNPASVMNSEVTLLNQSSSDVVNWYYYFGDGDSIAPFVSSPTHTYPNQNPQTYNATLYVMNGYGCWDTVAHPVIIGPEFTFYIPNAFTPNGDGINDTFNGKGIGIAKYDIWIFDRWGNMIFHSDQIDPYDAWDGRANNGSDIAQQDVYVWKVKLTDVFNKKHSYVGTVTLVK